MRGLITKRDWWEVARVFGWRKALKLLFARQRTALLLLMG